MALPQLEAEINRESQERAIRYRENLQRKGEGFYQSLLKAEGYCAGWREAQMQRIGEFVPGVTPEPGGEG